MPEIQHEFPIAASVGDVFRAISDPVGLDAWWTLTCSGKPAQGEIYRLGFGPGYNWQARVTQCQPGSRFELQLTEADPDWLGTRVGFDLSEEEGVTHVRFRHAGWPADNRHYRISSFCWAMYLRLLKKYVERGAVVPYQDRLEA